MPLWWCGINIHTEITFHWFAFTLLKLEVGHYGAVHKNVQHQLIEFFSLRLSFQCSFSKKTDALFIHHLLVNYILQLLQKCPISDIFWTFALFVEAPKPYFAQRWHHYLQITVDWNDLFPALLPAASRYSEHGVIFLVGTDDYHLSWQYRPLASLQRIYFNAFKNIFSKKFIVNNYLDHTSNPRCYGPQDVATQPWTRWTTGVTGPLFTRVCLLSRVCTTATLQLPGSSAPNILIFTFSQWCQKVSKLHFCIVASIQAQ